MARGFTDDKGKFRPTGRNNGKSSREKSLEPNGMIMNSDGSTTKEIKVWSIDNAPLDLKEKILEKLRNNKGEFLDPSFIAEDEGLIYDENEKKDFSDIGLKNVFPKYFDVGSNRGTDFVQFRDLDIEDEDKFARYLGIPKELQKRIKFRIENDENRDMSNTTLEIIPPDTRGGSWGEGNIDSNSALDDLWKYNNEEIAPEDKLSENDLETLIDAVQKFEKLMDMALDNLRRNYEYQFEDETLVEDAIANEWQFDRDGDIV